MVLFNSTSNLNFRQNRANQNYGYFEKNLKYSTENSLNRNCCYSPSIAVDQVMEIERYYDAFPALGTPTSHFNGNISLSRCGTNQRNITRDSFIKMQLPLSPKPKQDADLKNGGDSLKLKHCSPKLPTKAGHFSPQKDNNCYNNFRRPTKYHNTKSKKRNCEQYKKQNATHQQLQIKREEAKPWKYLKEVKDRTNFSSAALPAVSNGNGEDSEEFISEEVLKSILKPDLDDVDTIDTVRYLWNEEVIEEQDSAVASLWQFNEVSLTDEYAEKYSEVITHCASEEHPVKLPYQSASGEASAGEEVSDYDMIEQSLASIKFCESIPDGCKDSKLMPLFRENPFSYIIQQSSFASTDASEFSPPQSFTCKHCQETYEIVLESESASVQRNRAATGVLGLIDSRLDFDWCKYHPPPWLTTNFNDDKIVSEHKHEAKNGCDCEFCRSRIWQSTCKWCATPLY